MTGELSREPPPKPNWKGEVARVADPKPKAEV